MNTINKVRALFWESHPEFKNEFKVKKRQNDYKTDIRCCFVDFVDFLQKSGQISEKLANKVTL